MERVTGIGGLFFRARDPVVLAAWYEQHLGIGPVPQDLDTRPWQAEAGPVVFAPFAADSDYFAADRAFMMNFRVADLDRMLAELRAAGIAISHEMALDGIGRFARVHDPEDNPIELWQPA